MSKKNAKTTKKIMKTKTPVVMQVLPSMHMGGVERGTVEVAKAIIDKGWHAIVVSAGGPMENDLRRIGAEHITLSIDTKRLSKMFSKNVKKLENIIKEKNVDIVHARSRAPAWSAKKAAKRQGVPFVTTFHGTYGLGYFELKKHYNKIMAGGDLVIAISNFISDHIKQHYKTPVEKIRLVHRGVDTEIFSPAKVSAERIMRMIKKLRIPEDKHIVMLPGRLTRWKGQKILIEAMARLERENVICLLVGSSQGRKEYCKELERLAKKRGIENLIYIVEDCDDIAAAYMLADIVVSASINPEAFGRVSIEGQAMGRIVIASNHGGSKETIIDGHTGYLVAPNDAVALNNAIVKALNLNSKDRQDMSSRAIDNASKNFSKDTMCKKVLDVYEEML